MRVVFMGNHTVGVRTLATLCRTCEVVGVVAHPADVEDGIRYESVFEYACYQGLEVERRRPTDEGFHQFIRHAKPDLIWLTDYRYIVPTDILNLAPMGAINLHPSLLPKYRGRAPLNWAIIHGETPLGLTAHCVTEDVDAGDIIEQRAFDLGPDEDVGDALSKLYPLYEEITEEVVASLAKGTANRIPQPEGKHPVYPARRPDDGIIDWGKSASEIRNLIRGVARPYPGAFSYVGDKCVTIWKGHVKHSQVEAEPGTIVKVSGKASFEIACGGGVIVATDFSIDVADDELTIGDRFMPKKQATVATT